MEDFPAGKMKVDEFITQRLPLDKINEAFELMQGKALRPVITSDNDINDWNGKQLELSIARSKVTSLLKLIKLMVKLRVPVGKLSPNKFKAIIKFLTFVPVFEIALNICVKKVRYFHGIRVRPKSFSIWDVL